MKEVSTLRGAEASLPIPGTKKRKYLEENTAALEVSITAKDEIAIAELLDRFPHIDERYSEAARKLINN